MSHCTAASTLWYLVRGKDLVLQIDHTESKSKRGQGVETKTHTKSLKLY